MAGLGGKAPSVSMPAPVEIKPPPAPKPVRMPSETDPALLAAADRTREAALARRGRLSTIMTDQTKQTIGSSGGKLGG